MKELYILNLGAGEKPGSLQYQTFAGFYQECIGLCGN
jgi:hypothetical protein